jgi:CheY-like chemotaxis protein
MLVNLPGAAPERAVPGDTPVDTEEARNRATGAFLACLNHEIRTPLSGVMGMVDLLLETPLTDEQRDYINAARMCTESLFELLNAMLEYSALEAGHLTLDESEFSVREVFESVMAHHRAKADAKSLRCWVRLDPALPETLLGDGPRLKELLGHLVANAVKFTLAGTVELYASSHPDDAGGEVLSVDVRDTGIGIPPGRLGAIFESFHQGETGLARSYSGLGLGLAVARKLAHLMHGRILVESQEEVGSTFTVELPLHRPTGILSHHASLAAAASSGPRILAVDDNPVSLKVLRHTLGRRGVQVDCAESARQALDAAAQRQYDLVLMDLQMPDVDGLTAAAELRAVPGYQTVPIIALTANYSDEVRDQCRACGMQGFLSKPIEGDRLWAGLSRYLKTSGAGDLVACQS